MSHASDLCRRYRSYAWTVSVLKVLITLLLYTLMLCSVTTSSYRFANEPESKKEEDTTTQRVFYSGKLQLQFRQDGYTDILSSADESSKSTATFNKAWGWDLETSNQDSLDYILFSADVSLPPPISTKERFYFQARVDKDAKSNNLLSLQDGSVTVKRNIESPAGGGWWGIFRGADGILAQFRQVGEFRCKPVPPAGQGDGTDGQ